MSNTSSASTDGWAWYVGRRRPANNDAMHSFENHESYVNSAQHDALCSIRLQTHTLPPSIFAPKCRVPCPGLCQEHPSALGRKPYKCNEDVSSHLSDIAFKFRHLTCCHKHHQRF
eukprot:4435649-Amphidinium_carterae.1